MVYVVSVGWARQRVLYVESVVYVVYVGWTGQQMFKSQQVCKRV